MASVIGIHIGAEEVRTILTDETGSVAGKSQIHIHEQKEDKPSTSGTEQEPELIWQKVLTCVQELSKKAAPEDIAAVGISSASGTIIPIDADGKALCPAITRENNFDVQEFQSPSPNPLPHGERAVMKERAKSPFPHGERNKPALSPDLINGQEVRGYIAPDEAKLVTQKGEKLIRKLGYRADELTSLAKILRLKNHSAELYQKTRKFINVSDFIVGKLTGEFSTTDTSNALHAGYDIIDFKWPAFIRELGIMPECLPKVVKPGEPVGSILQSVADKTGLSTHTAVIAGTTEEITNFVSSGAASAGQWNSYLGEKLRVTGISSKLIKDKLSRIYSHLHPENLWITTGKSSVGEGGLKEKFRGEDLSQLNASLKTSSLIVYPLNHEGEKFPFVNKDAQGFIIGKPDNKYDLYSGYIEGIGYIEKWIFELLGELGFEIDEEIFVTGFRNEHQLQIRANILEKVLLVPAEGSPEIGAAVLSASKTLFNNLEAATKSMVRIEKRIEPESTDIYRSKYRKFRQVCRAIGYE